MPTNSPVRVLKSGSLTGLGQGKSRVTNGGRLNLFGDGRTFTGRRFRDLVAQFSAQLGGFVLLDPITQQLVRRCATLSVQAETYEAQLAAGEAVDPIAFTTVTNALNRCLARLEAKRPPETKPREPTLQEIAREIASAKGSPA